MDDNPKEGFHKMEYLVNFIPEMPGRLALSLFLTFLVIFGNLLLLNCQYGRFSVALDLLLDNSHLRKYVDPVI